MKKPGRFFFIILCFCLLLCCASNLAPKAYAASTMTASNSCVEFIKQVEGFSAKPYYDYSQHTVGYGTKCPSDKYFEYMANGIPREEAEALLQQTLADISRDIQQKLMQPYNLTFAQHQFDALVSFSFNIGTGWMTYDSTLRNALLRNAGTDELVYAFSLYCTAGGNYSSGLINRRLCEANMFLNGIYSRNAGNAYGYVFYDPNGGSLTYRVQGFVCGNSASPAADAVRSGDVFLGWYTDLNGGTLVTELNGTLSGRTLFARWQSAANAPAEDSSSTLITVTGDVVNIRKGPGTNYGTSKQVYRNDVLILSHVTHLSNMKWGKVQDGWICLDYTNYETILNGTDSSAPGADNQPSVPENTPQTTPVPVSGTVRVNDLLRIRSGPGTAHATVGYLFNGNQVQILEQKTVGSMSWGRMNRGWVSMDYIVTEEFSTEVTPPPATEPIRETEPPRETEPVQTPPEPADQPQSSVIKGIITADALRIRSGPGSENAIVGFYYQNDPVVITELVAVNSEYWGKTDIGWVHMNYVQTDALSPEPTPPAEGRVMTVIADCLRVRKEARTDSRISQLLYYGDKVTVLETVTVNGTAWGRVHNGWVCMDYVA